MGKFSRFGGGGHGEDSMIRVFCKVGVWVVWENTSPNSSHNSPANGTKNKKIPTNIALDKR